MSIADNLSNIKNRISHVCNKVGRDASAIDIIAVSKTVTEVRIKEAIEAGISNIGENRVQDAWQKYQILGSSAIWHMIGRLQTNKVKRALQFFDFIHSVESKHLAEEISRRADQLGKDINILIEVNTSGEDTKIGVDPEKTVGFLKQIAHLPRLNILGLMTIGAFLPDPEQVRPCFITLRELRDRIISEGFDEIHMKYLSMGMTDDFEVAIEEGSNMVRIGRAIFGDRL